jgi:pimeloyl-ACP methyl ester carboxylesterase
MSWDSRQSVSSLDGTAIAVHTLGSGPGLVVLGGALQAADNYRGLAGLLGTTFTVHVPDRRGRGGSGPHGTGYAISKEVQDLQAVQRATGARAVFGHSYGGLVVLETLARGTDFAWASVFEPGVSIQHSIQADWVPVYRAMLARGDTYGAFAHFIRCNPQSPAIARLLPRWYLRLALHAMPRFHDRIGPLLEGNALEHEQVAEHNDQFPTYRSIRGDVQLLAGAKSPDFVIATMRTLNGVILGSTATVLAGLNHMAPLAKQPTAVATAIAAHLPADHMR